MFEPDENKLVAEHGNMAHKIAGVMYFRLLPCLQQLYIYDDVVQFGIMGLLLANRGFDPSRGVKFSTYAYVCIRRSIERHTARERRALMRMPTCLVPNFSEGDMDGNNGLPFAPPAKDENKEFTTEEFVRFNRWCFALLEERERTVVEMRLEKIPYQVIGDSLGVSKARAQQIYAKTIYKLRRNRTIRKFIKATTA